MEKKVTKKAKVVVKLKNHKTNNLTWPEYAGFAVCR